MMMPMKLFGDVDDDALLRLEFAPVFVANDDFACRPSIQNLRGRMVR